MQAAIAAGGDLTAIEISAPEKIDVETLRKEAAATATASEKDRITGIQALAAPGFETEVQAAIDDGLTVEAAGLSLFKAAQDRGVTLDSIKRDAKKVDPASASAGKGKPEFSTKSIWASRKGAKA